MRDFLKKINRFAVNCFLGLVPLSKWRKLLRHLLLGDPLSDEWVAMRHRMVYGDKHVYVAQDGADAIYGELCMPKPSLICRFGSLELCTLWQFVNNKGRKIKFENKEAMYNNTGFFPATDYMLSRFSSELVEIAKEIDILGVSSFDEEFDIVQRYCPNIRIADLTAIGDVNFERPWTRFLEGKKVLVIHPFAETIKSQYNKRELLFENKLVLPDFDLKIIKAVQSIADEKDNLPFKTWFEALDYMKEQIKATDFDIALIGAGAYGIFLAHYCKTLGKKAVHMSSAVQLLFGIKGKRWDNMGFYNEHWVYPSKNEIPKGAEKVEGGCYWGNLK